MDNLLVGKSDPPCLKQDQVSVLLSSAAPPDEESFRKQFRGCEYSFRYGPHFPFASRRNPYSHRAGIFIHITPERLFTSPGIRTE